MTKDMEDRFIEALENGDKIAAILEIHKRLEPFTKATAEVIERHKQSLSPKEMIGSLIWDAALIAYSSAPDRKSAIAFLKKTLDFACIGIQHRK